MGQRAYICRGALVLRTMTQEVISRIRSCTAPILPARGKLGVAGRTVGRTHAFQIALFGPGRMKPDLLRRREAIALLAAIAVAWGTSWPVIKAILQDLPPMWTTGLRSAIGTAILFTISAFRGTVALPQRGDVPVVLNIALLHMVAFTGLISVGLQFVRPDARSFLVTPLRCG